MTKYFISVGSNMGDRLAHLRYAAEAFSAHGITLHRKSSVYETAPWGNEEQDFFLNAIFLVGWDGTPEALLRELQGIEAERGRRREVHWGPRTLDLDIIWGDGVALCTDTLTIPHPFFAERAFVLVPLAELAPDFSIGGVSIETHMQERNGQEDVRLFTKIW